MSPAEKILRRMRSTKTGWTPSDFERLYEGFGFVKVEGASHTIYLDAATGLRATVARHPHLATGYAATAVKIIDEYKAKEKAARDREERTHADGYPNPR